MADVARELLAELLKDLTDIEDRTSSDHESFAVCGNIDQSLVARVEETLSAQDDPDCEKYRAAAREAYEREGEIEIDEGAPVSRGDDPGAYVQAWVWVSNEQAGIETEPEDSEDDEDDPLSECQDCGVCWKESQLKNVGNIPDLYKRVAPGEPMPTGECPDCGALCQLVTEQPAEVSRG